MRIWKEPLFHFVLLGAAIFVWYAWLNPADPDVGQADRIVVDVQDAERLSEQFRATWRRRPTEAELAGLINAQVRQEVLVRQAKELGLDQGDGIIRNRLAQKMEFLTTSVAQAMEPPDDVLAAHLEQHADTFAIPARVAFEQVPLAPSDDPATALQALQLGADPASLAQSSLLPPALPLSPRPAVDGVFGRGFYSAIEVIPVGQWAGPVESGYGTHLVRLLERTESTVPPLAEIRQKVLADWRRVKAAELTSAQLDILKDQFEVVTPEPADLADWTAQ